MVADRRLRPRARRRNGTIRVREVPESSAEEAAQLLERVQGSREAPQRETSQEQPKTAYVTTKVDQRFDQVNRTLADNRERTAELAGALEGFLAGRCERDAT